MFRICNWLIALFLLPQMGFSLPVDTEQKMHITADATVFNFKSGEDLYQGHVIIDQGTTHLHADRVITQKNKAHKIEVATAYGINTLAEYTTTPKLGDQLLQAQAKQIKYYPQKSTVLLQGNAMMAQGENHFHGNVMIYNMKDQTIASPPTLLGQSTIIIEPK